MIREEEEKKDKKGCGKALFKADGLILYFFINY
jgi:hypothetical protein